LVGGGLGRECHFHPPKKKEKTYPHQKNRAQKREREREMPFYSKKDENALTEMEPQQPVVLSIKEENETQERPLSINVPFFVGYQIYCCFMCILACAGMFGIPVMILYLCLFNGLTNAAPVVLIGPILVLLWILFLKKAHGVITKYFSQQIQLEVVVSRISLEERIND
jgi:hypothetical protein